VTESALERARERIAGLAGRGLDLVALWTEARELLTPVMPYHLTPCWYTFDPASLLVTSHFDHGMIPEVPAEWFAHEYHDEDVHKLADVARSPRGISTLHDATDGDPSRSPGWNQYVRPYGGDQQVLVTLRTGDGEAWGMLALFRAPDQPMFTGAELEFLKSISSPLAEAARRALLVGEASEPEGPDAPGLVVLAKNSEVESASPGAERWLSELPGGDPGGGPLPAVVLAVAGRALGAGEPGGHTDAHAFARVRSNKGRWLAVHGVPLETSEGRRAAVIIEPAHPARIASLLLAAYGLSEREKDVTRLVLQGQSTEEIAGSLFISPHTVQQHLKSVFAKTGVRRRRELAGRIFSAHYEPRVRDNERRATDGAALRGGPMWP
jgi:DNA-binding CsgD family transcriptional regulator